MTGLEPVTLSGGGIIKAFFEFIIGLISGTFPLMLLLICGVYLSFKGRLFQLTRFGDSVKLMLKALKEKKQSGKFSSFQAACTSLSASVGTGNIAGVAGAVSIGGAGAVFWLWVSALAGMCIKAAEIVISTKFREKQGENYVGGPMYYIKNGLPKAFSFLSVLFCAVGIPAVFCTGNITQTNATASALSDKFLPRLILGIIFTLLTFAVIRGGIGKIGAVTEKIVPVMSVLYIILCGSIIILNIDFLPSAFKMIIVGAFNPKAVTGGAVGSFITAALTGASRGVFSNEAGLGTSGMSHSAAFDANPETQGLFGIFEVFVDTILLCTLTALTLLCSGTEINYGKVASSELVIKALHDAYGGYAKPIISVMLCVFAFSSIIGWAVYGSICSRFLLGEKGEKIFLFIYPLTSLFGALSDSAVAWKLSEFFNGLMLIINIPVILLLWSSAENYLKKRGKNNVKSKNIKSERIFK